MIGLGPGLIQQLAGVALGVHADGGGGFPGGVEHPGRLGPEQLGDLLFVQVGRGHRSAVLELADPGGQLGLAGLERGQLAGHPGQEAADLGGVEASEGVAERGPGDSVGLERPGQHSGAGVSHRA